MKQYNYERDEETFSASAYKEKDSLLIAWTILGWEIENENRTGSVVAVMVGDDREFLFQPKDLEPVEEYCGSCGQIGCCYEG